MSNITLSIPEETALALQLGPDALAAELQLAAAIKLHEMGRLSSGAAAALAGIPRTVFLSKLAEYGVATFRMNLEELQEDLARA
jgi:predicted HTH domain antitoxin